MKEEVSKTARDGLLAGGLTDADINRKSDIFEHYKDISHKIIKHDLGKVTGRFK